MKKRMIIMLICVGILFGAIFGFKLFTNHMIKGFIASQKYIATISTTKVSYSLWDSKLSAVGSVRAIRGVSVTTELAGLVQTIYFTPGSSVTQGKPLVQLNAAPDIAALHALQANAALALTTYNRDKKQYAIHAISKAILDNDIGNLKNINAQVAQQEATVAKKTIRAPFSGRLGISAVNLGQYLNAGDMVVTLQTLDPIWVDFYLPQQALAQLQVGQPVIVSTDTYPGKTFTGKITTINPIVDTATRNVEVEATIANPAYKLIPGMFVSVDITIGPPKRYLTLPQTAISFNPYGQLVYMVKQTGSDNKGNPILIANQSFVTTGPTRGDQIVILDGLKEGDEVVIGGQLKLKNGTQVTINNSVQPANNPVPKLPNER